MYTASLVVYVVFPERDDSVKECDEKFIMSLGADLFSHVVIALTKKRQKAPEFSNNSYGRQNAVKFAQVIA